MVTYLDDDNLVAMTKRAIAPPGAFTTTWPTLADEDVANILADGFATAQMQGWFPAFSYDVNMLTVTPDLSVAAQMLCVSYASIKILRYRLMELQRGTHYKAGPAEASVTGQSNVLVALLSSAQGEIDFIKNQALLRVVPIIGDLTSVRLLGETGFSFETTELPVAGRQGALGLEWF